MNKEAFKAEMKAHHENGKILAKAMGITEQTFCNKKKNGTFTQPQMKFIGDRYKMSPKRFQEVFMED